MKTFILTRQCLAHVEERYVVEAESKDEAEALFEDLETREADDAYLVPRVQEIIDIIEVNEITVEEAKEGDSILDLPEQA